MVEEDVPVLYDALVSRLAPLGLAYLHHAVNPYELVPRSTSIIPDHDLVTAKRA